MPFKAAVNTYLVFQFVRELTKDWTEMDAYELGIIDEKGNILKKSKDLVTNTERASYTMFHRLIWNIKKTLEALPGGASKLKSYAAAAWLLKENIEAVQKALLEFEEPSDLDEAKALFEEITGTPVINVSAGVAKKDMPLRRKKKTTEDEEDMECKETTISSLRNKIEEGKRMRKVVRGGELKKKATCPEGQILKDGKCVMATSSDKQMFIKAAKKRKRSMAGKSLSAMQRKRAKSTRKRNSAGL